MKITHRFYHVILGFRQTSPHNFEICTVSL